MTHLYCTHGCSSRTQVRTHHPLFLPGPETVSAGANHRWMCSILAAAALFLRQLANGQTEIEITRSNNTHRTQQQRQQQQQQHVLVARALDVVAVVVGHQIAVVVVSAVGPGDVRRSYYYNSALAAVEVIRLG